MSTLKTVKCDFCSRKVPIVHVYKCESYKSEVVPSVESIDEWTACEDCERFIEAGEWIELAKFCATLMVQSKFRFSTRIHLILRLHDEFREHRI